MKIGIGVGAMLRAGKQFYGEAAWTPLDLGAKLKAWWRSDQGFDDNNDEWSDVVDGILLTPAGGNSANFPTEVASIFGSKPAIRFDGDNDVLVMDSTINNNMYMDDLITVSTGVVVAQFRLRSNATSNNTGATAYSNNAIWSTSGGIAGTHIRYDGSSNYIFSGNYDTDMDTSGTSNDTVSLSTTYVSRWQHDGGQLRHVLDASEFNASSGNTDSSLATDILVVGCDFSGATYNTAIDLANLLILNDTMTGDEITDLMAWLADYTA